MPYKDPDVRRVKCREYHRNHREEILDRQKKRYAKNKDHDNQIKKNWYDRHPEAREKDLERLAEWGKLHNHRRYRRVMIESEREEICSVCGTTEDVCVHHIDGDHNNESLDNLQWVCRSCHAKLHAEQRRRLNAKH